VTVHPHVAIVLSIEGRPCVRVNASTEEQERRLTDWLHASGYWARIVDLALEIADGGREAA
jgi:hypothetical protein